jgi:hypothetical protein
VHYLEILDSLLFTQYTEQQKATMAHNLGKTAGGLVGTIGGGAGGMYGGGLLAKAYSKHPMAGTIGVIGGGLAGLYAGDELGKLGGSALSKGYYRGAKNKDEEWKRLKTIGTVSGITSGAVAGHGVNEGLRIMAGKWPAVPFDKTRLILPAVGALGLGYIANRVMARNEKGYKRAGR